MSAATYTRPTEAKTQNREAWLTSAADHLWNRVLEDADAKRPEVFRISCGWPSKSALMTASSSRRRIGEAWHSEASEDQAREVFISPALVDEVQVMGVILHELIHAALAAGEGHGPAFQRIMRRVGLGGKPTATEVDPGSDLEGELVVIADLIGRYPHAKLDASVKPGKPGRMVKGYCPDCGNILYGSRTAWDVAPLCAACGTGYVVEPSDAQAVAWGLAKTDATEPLENVSTTIELKTRDGRFTLRSTKTGGREGKWMVTDHHAVEASRDELEVGGEVFEAFAHDSRWTYRENRADALAFIAALRSGDMTWDLVEDAQGEDDEDDFDAWDELDDELTDDELERELYLGDDEDEDADYPEDQPIADDAADIMASALDRAKAFTSRPATEAEFSEMERLRDESGARKSATIAAGDEGAMD